MTKEILKDKIEARAVLIVRAGVNHWNLTRDNKFNSLTWVEKKNVCEYYLDHPKTLVIAGLLTQLVVDEYKLFSAQKEKAERDDLIGLLTNEAKRYASKD